MGSVKFPVLIASCAIFALLPAFTVGAPDVELDSEYELVFPLRDFHPSEYELREFVKESRDASWHMQPVADLAKKIPSLFMEVPWGFIEDVAKGEIDIIAGFSSIMRADFSSEEAEHLLEIIKSEVVVVAVVLFFVMLAILSPLVGVLYVCCRWVCCNYKNRVTVEKASKQSCCCCVLTVVILSIFSVIILGAGAASVYMLGHRIGSSTDYLIDEAATSFFHDTKHFIDDIIKGSEKVGVDDLTGVVDIMDSEFTATTTHVLAPYSAEVDDHPQVVIDNLGGIQSAAVSARAELDALDSVIDGMQQAYDDFESQLPAIISEINDVISICQAQSFSCQDQDSDSIISDLQTVTYPIVNTSDLHVYYDTLTTDVNYAEIQAQAETYGEEEQLIGDALDPIVADIKNEMLSFDPAEVDSMLDDVRDPLLEVKDSVISLEETVDDEKEMMDDYLTYMMYAFFAISGCLGLIALLNLLGLFFGIPGGTVYKKPEYRSCVTKCGGCCLVGSACCSMFFITLFCILGSVMFIVGTYLTVGCKSIEDFSIFDQVIDNPNMWDGRNMASELFGFAKISNQTVRSTLEGCRDHGNFFDVLNLMDLIDFSDIADNDELRSNSGVENITLMTMDAVKNVGVTDSLLRTTLNNKPPDILQKFDAKAFFTLSPMTSGASFLDDLRTDPELTNYWDTNTLSTAEILNDFSIFLEEARDNATTLKTDVRVAILHFKDAVQSLDNQLTVLRSSLNVLKAAPDTLNESAENFIGRMLGYTDVYLNHVDISMAEISECEVVWLMYDAASEGLCHYVLDIINILWFTFLIVALALVFTIFAGFSMYKYYTIPVDAVDHQRYAVYRTHSHNTGYQKAMNEMKKKMDPVTHPGKPNDGYRRLITTARRMSQELPQRITKH